MNGFRIPGLQGKRAPEQRNVTRGSERKGADRAEQLSEAPPAQGTITKLQSNLETLPCTM